MFPVPWLGALTQAEAVPRHAHLPAVDELHGLLVGIVREHGTFQHQMFAIPDDEPGCATNRRPAAMFRPQNDRRLRRAALALDAYRTLRLVCAIAHQHRHARPQPAYRPFKLGQ